MHQPLEHIRADPRTGHPGAVQRLRAWLQAVASQMPASRGPEAVSEPPRPGHAFLTKTFFPFTDGKKNSQGAGYGTNCSVITATWTWGIF